MDLKKPTMHTHNLELIAEFEKLQLNDFDLALKAHPAHDIMKIPVYRKHVKLKPGSRIQLALSVNEPAFVRKYAPLPLQAPYANTNAIQKHIPEPSAPHSSNTNILNKIAPSHQGKSDPHKCLGPHTICSYVVGKGMVWEDLCRCDENDKTT
jgi:hypothetical protein